jgi:hypothetical protein
MAPALVVALVALAGCGLGAGQGARGVSVVVTRDFGTRIVGAARVGRTPGEETAMRLLQRHFGVRTRYGGAFVQSIDGLAGDAAARPPVDWFFYVNGIESSRGAAAVRLHPGDRVWWDRHEWGEAMSVPAVVGSFPEPFRSGAGGRRIPAVVACAPAATACDIARARLAAAGVRAGRTVVGAPLGRDTLRVVVGAWRDVRRDLSARRIESGPRISGVFASLPADGTTLSLLDAGGRTVTRLGPGAGLIAATRSRDEQPTWVVTGTDAAGAAAAARRLTARDLRRHFALAVAPGGAPVPLPAGRP